MKGDCQMTEVKKILVEVFGGVNASSCGWGGGCSAGSVGAKLEDTVNAHAKQLITEFGSALEVKYIDTAKEGLDQFPELKKITDAGYSFPITSVNGEARLAGDVIYEDLKMIIEETIEETIFE